MSMTDAHPAAFTEDHVVNGFSRIRLCGSDIGPERTTILVVEILGKLRYLRKDQKKQQQLLQLQQDTHPDNTDDNDAYADGDFVSSIVQTLSSDPSKTDKDLLNPLTWKERLDFISDKWEMIAVYVIRWRTDQLLYFVNPLVEDSEVNANAATIQSVVERAAQLREANFPQQQVIMHGGASAHQAAAAAAYAAEPTSKMFLSYNLLERALSPKTFTSQDMLPFKNASSEEMGYDMLNMIDNGVTMFLNYAPALAPLFLYQSPLFVENQVDNLWNRLYQQSTDKLADATKQLALAIQSVPDNAELQFELIRIYERMRGANTVPPRNWGLSLVLISVIKTMDALWGHIGKRPVMFVASKGTASYLKDQKPSYYDPSAMSDKQRYHTRKMAAVQVYDALLQRKVEQSPTVYGPLSHFMHNTLSVRGKDGQMQAKLDDVFDPLGMIIAAAETHLRDRPYTVAEAPKVSKAMEVWRKCGERMRLPQGTPETNNNQQGPAFLSTPSQQRQAWKPPRGIDDILASCQALDEDLFTAEELRTNTKATNARSDSAAQQQQQQPHKPVAGAGAAAKPSAPKATPARAPSAPLVQKPLPVVARATVRSASETERQRPPPQRPPPSTQFLMPPTRKDQPLKQGQLLFEQKTGRVSLAGSGKSGKSNRPNAAAAAAVRPPAKRKASHVIDLVDMNDDDFFSNEFMSGLFKDPIRHVTANDAAPPSPPTQRQKRKRTDAPNATAPAAARAASPRVLPLYNDDDVVIYDDDDQDEGTAPKRRKTDTVQHRESEIRAPKSRARSRQSEPRSNHMRTPSAKASFGGGSYVAGAEFDEFDDLLANPYGGI